MKRFLQWKNIWMYHVWLRSFMVCLCLALSGLSAWGQNNFGDFDVSGETTNAAYENDVLTITGSGVIVKNLDFGTATNDRIVIDGGTKDSPIEVTLAGVNMETEENNRLPITINSGSYVELILTGNNTIIPPKLSNGTAATHGVLYLEGDGDNGAFSSLTIKGTGELNVYGNRQINAIGGINSKINIEEDVNINIEDGGIGGQNSTVNISGGKIVLTNPVSYNACIGGGNISKVYISGNSDIKIINPEKDAIYANIINISGGKLEISVNEESTSSVDGIVCRGSDEPDTQGTLNISGGEIIITDKRNSKKMDGITTYQARSTMPVSVTISEDASVKMDVTNGISGGRKTNLYIKDEALVDIKSTQTPISITSADISGKALVLLKSSTNHRGIDIETSSLYDGHLTTGDNGNAYIISDTKYNNSIEEKNRTNWKGIVLEGSRDNNFVSGYVYGNMVLDRNFELKENYHLVFCDPSELTINESYKLINNGGVFIAYEKEHIGLEEKINAGGGQGKYHYQVFYDEESLQVPAELLKRADISDIILSDKFTHKVNHPNSSDPKGNMVFGESNSRITLSIDNVQESRFKQGEYAGYELKSFKVKTKKDGTPIEVTDLSFDMPEEAIVIYDLVIEKKRYKLNYTLAEGAEGLEVHFENTKRNVVTDMGFGSSVFVVITAPGYEKFNVTSVTAKCDHNFDTLESGILAYYPDGERNDKEVVWVLYLMPKDDVTFTIGGTAEEQQTYTVTVGKVTNGKVELSYGTGVVPNAIHYNDVINVKAIPDEGYQIKKLYYKEEGSENTVTISNNSFEMPAANVTVYATFEAIKYRVSISGDIENGTVTASPTEATVGETITLTVTPNNGYQLDKLYYIATGTTTEVPITGMTFTMPAANVTVYATFKEKEDPTDPEEPVDPPVDPINYYNIYNETTYDFIDVSFSRNVVREGGSINVYLEIPEGLDPTAVTLMYKRGMYNNWETLDEGVQPGEYPINNIWSDIYVKAVVDESYIDPNPDENHIYIDLSETNDSIWLYTERKLVEEGKTAVIQAEVAKSCQNKEIHYMYKRTVLGEWKEMPKDYSINKYVVRDITTDIYVKAYFVFDKQDPTTAKNPHHVYADITATCEGLYLDATRHKVADEGDTKVFLYVKKGFETKDARYLFKRGLKGEWEDLVPGIEQNTFEVTNIEEDIYLKGIDAIYTGTEGVDGVIRVYTKDGSLFVYTAQPEEISVVSMTGVTVKRTRQTGLQSYPLNQGIYVVCVGEQVFKVRVK
ncbi:MAG TPA: hypothetical protein H9984_02190 [Candidatus Parabacteroides faecavium]|nr:hypothetical protein [Candidatus Parabacteroides faecavium]